MANAAVHTVRIEGVIIPPNAHIVIGLQSVYGIGKTRAQEICAATGVPENAKTHQLEDEQVRALQTAVEKYEVEGNLRRKVAMHIKRLRDIRCYRGIRHSRRLPCRGQRTRTNSRTVRGKGKGSTTKTGGKGK